MRATQLKKVLLTAFLMVAVLITKSQVKGVPLGGTLPGFPIYGNLYFTGSNRYIIGKNTFGDSTSFDFSIRPGAVASVLHSYDNSGVFSQIFTMAGSGQTDLGLESYGKKYFTGYEQDTITISIECNFPQFKGLQYEVNTCDYVNAHADSTSIIHKGFIQRLIAVATPSITLTGDVTSTGTGTLTTTVNKILNKSISTPSVGYFYYNGTSFTYTTAASPLVFNTPLSVTSNTVTISYGTGLSINTGSLVTSNIPNVSLANSTISGVSLGGNLFNHSAGYGLSGSAYNGSGAISWSADTTSLASKLYVTAKIGGYLTKLNPLYTGLLSTGAPTYTASNTLGFLNSSVNNFNQFIIQNSSNGSTASTGYITNNDQSTNTTFYGEFGQNSSGFTGSGAFNQPNYVYLTSNSTDLAIGTTSANAIHFVINSGALDALTINTDGTTSLRIKPRVATVTTSTLITINTDATDIYTVTSLTAATTFTVPTGTPVAGQSLIIRIKSDASPHALTFSTGTNGFRFSTDAPAPTTTTASKSMYVGFRWNEADSKWDNLSPYLDNF